MIRIFLLSILVLPISASATCKSSTIEPFAKFFKVFGENNSFATKRTDYPLTVLDHESTDDNPENHAVVSRQISKSDDAAELPLAVFARENKLELSILSRQDVHAVVRMQKTDTDWMLIYHFVRKGACWYLSRIEDYSL